MIDPALSIIFSTSILVFFRLLKPAPGATLQVITINYIVASLLGLASSDYSSEEFISQWPPWSAIAIILGFLFIGTFFLFALSSRQSGVALTAVASRMSVLIPVLGGLIIFGETGGVTRWIGLAIVFPALYYSIYNKERSDKLAINQSLLPIALLIGTGMNDLLMNYATRTYAPVDLPFMLTIIFGIAFVIGSSILTFKMLMSQLKFNLSLIPAGILLGLINYASTFFLLRSMNKYDATVLFPVVNASIVLLAAIIDISFFKHRPSSRQFAGFVLAIISIVLITSG